MLSRREEPDLPVQIEAREIDECGAFAARYTVGNVDRGGRHALRVRTLLSGRQRPTVVTNCLEFERRRLGLTVWVVPNSNRGPFRREVRVSH